jgi:putative drug exporter of the RND superfamily
VALPRAGAGELLFVGTGVGTTAVLIDATVTPMVLVPATMALLAKVNWWLPGWLGRILPQLGDHDTVLATPVDREQDRVLTVV